MKKIFSFVFAVALATSLWATQTVVPAGSGTPESQIKAAVEAASAGDTLVLETANYVEWNSITVDKKITLMAADGAQPMVKVAKFKVKAPFEINGVECYSHNSDYMFYTEANVDGVVALKNCTLRDCVHNMYYIVSGYTVNTLIIDNCLFKNLTKADNAVIYGDGTITNFEMRNSTVMNCTGKYPIRVKKASSIIVDHCTFYNNGERVMLLGDNTAPATCAVSNCVISNPSVVTSYCFSTYAGTVDNIVYYNTASDPRSSSSVNNKIVNADPQFVDVANGNLNFAFTSPLFLAATDGSNIGDPRWGVEAGEGIAVPDTLDNAEATLAGKKISLTDDGIKWNDNSATPADNSASWVIDADKAGYYDIVVNQSAASMGHRFIVSLAGEEAWLDTIEEAANSWDSGDIMIGTFQIAKAGKYLVRLTNGMQYSSAVVKYFMVNYAGGGVVEIPAVLPNEEAMLNGPKIKKTADGIAWNDNGDATQDYAVWNINVAKAGDYTVNMVVSTANSSGHSFSIDIYDSNNQQVGSTIAEPSGDITLAAGTYTVRLNNGTQWSSAIMESVSIFYKGGGVMAIPGQLPGEEALLAGDMIRLENGSMKWPNKSNVASHYATWNVTAAEDGDVDVYVHIGTPSSGHCFTAALYDGDETLISSVSEAETVHTTGEVKLGTISVEDAGTYTIRLTNATEWSSTIVDSLVVKEAEGPIEITLDQEDTENADLTTYLDKTVNVNLVRSMPTGMFSTICLPFGASKSGQFTGAKIYYLDSTYLKGDEVILCFKENSDFYQGIPYIIEPATAVNNPRFENVVIKKPTAGKTEKTHAIFHGTYFAKQLTPGDSNLLYLGQNNTLYFPPSGDTGSMMGLRAYFEIKQEPGAPIRRASIKMGTDVVTTLDLVNGQAVPEGKFMLNGQIIIRANGQDYLLNGMTR